MNADNADAAAALPSREEYERLLDELELSSFMSRGPTTIPGADRVWRDRRNAARAALLAAFDALRANCSAVPNSSTDAARGTATASDTERLDWLEQTGNDLSRLDDFVDDESRIGGWQVYTHDGQPIPPTGEFWDSLRSAIDAARHCMEPFDVR